MQDKYYYAFPGLWAKGQRANVGRAGETGSLSVLFKLRLFGLLSFCLWGLLPLAHAQRMAPEWSQQMPGGNMVALKRDAAGNIYVTGQKYVTGSGYDFVTNKYNAAGQVLWSKTYTYPYYGSSTGYYGGYTSEGPDEPVAMAVDAAGNVYVVGKVTTGIYYYTWSDGDSSPSFSTSYGIVKYNSDGDQVWTRTFSGSGSSGPGSLPEDIAVDAAGNVYVTGTVTTNYRTESYRSGFPSRTRYRTLSDQIFTTVKYNAAGDFQWASSYNGTVDASDAAKAVTVDGSGNVYVAGTVAGGTNNNNLGLVKYNASGAQQWVKIYTNSTNADEVVEMEADGAGNLYLIGSTTGYTYDPSWGSNMLDPIKCDFLTLKYRMSDGAQLWARAYNGPGNNTDAARAVTVDAAGNVYVVGSSMNSNVHLATVKYNASGAQLWAKSNVFAASSTSTSSPDGANAVVVDGSGNVYVAGGSGAYFSGAKYNSAGAQQWSIYNNKGGGRFGAVALAVDAAGNPFMAGDDKVIKFSPNAMPVAVNDTYAVDEDQTLTVTLADNHLLKNDTDADGNQLTAKVVTQPAKGTLTLNADGTFTYTPGANVNGTDSFTYRAHDGREDSQDAATVTITIHPVNDAPTWVLTTMPTVVDQDAGLQVVNNFASSIEDGDPDLTQNYSFVITSNSKPDLFKSIEVSRDGMLIFETVAGASGVATIGVKLKDDGGTARGGKDESEVKTYTITVQATNVAPTLANVPATVTIDEVKAYTFTATATDPDQPAQTLSFSLENAPASATIEATTGKFAWTPTEAQGPGTFTFKVKVSDGIATAEQSVTITVREVNTAPALASVPATVSIEEMKLFTFTAVGTDVDLPKQNLLYSLLNSPSGAQINPTTGVFTWTPTEEQGPKVYSNITVRVSDGLVSADKTITITVTEVNLPPTLANVPATATIPELQAYSFTATATDADRPVQALTFSLVNAPAGAGINASTGAFTWTPTEAQGPGVYAFKVRVTDGVGTAEKDITVTVTEDNTLPVLANVPLSASIQEGAVYTFVASATDVDEPAQPLTFSLVNGPAGAVIHPATGVFTWEPSETQGPNVFSFKVKVSDGLGAVEKEVSLTVSEVNEAPVLAAIPDKTAKENVLLSFTVSATDGDVPANTLSYALINAPLGATINATTGVFSWMPTEIQGPDVYVFTVRVLDNGSPAKYADQQVKVTVEEVNEAPVLSGVPATATIEELKAYTFTATATDKDIPNQKLTFSLLNAPAGATINATTGVFSWTPTEAQGAGSYTFKVRVTDGALADEATVTLQVTEVNVAPVLAAIQNQVTDEEKPFTFTASATDVDVPAQSLRFTLLNGPAGATINAQTGVFSWFPTEEQGPKVYSMTVQVSDTGTPALVDEQTFTITVNEVNKAPVLSSVPATATICEQQSYTFTAAAADADLPENTLRFTLVNAPAGASINATTGAFSWTPALNQGGAQYTVTIRVSDGVAQAEKQVNITVNKLPKISAQPQSKTVCVGGSHTFQVQTEGTSFVYRWQVDQGTGFVDLSDVGVYAGAKTAALTINGAVGSLNNYRYRVQVSGECVPGVTSQVATLRVVQPLHGGAISANQTVCYNAAPAALENTVAASGGDGTIQYTWESSQNNSTWTVISGAKGTSYVPGALTKTTYFRRKVSAADGCSTAQYSNVVQVEVQSEQKAGTLASVAPVCYGTPPAALQVSGELGNMPLYQWQSSADNVNWQDIAGARSASYAPGSLTASTYFRRRVTYGNGDCGALFTNAVWVVVYGQLQAGTISASQVVYYSDAPAKLMSDAPATGGSGTLAYQWESSKNGTSFSAIQGATGMTYQPGPLTQDAYFRRRVTDGACGSQVSNVVAIKVEVRKFEEQEIPNALFPNGSDRNKTWGISHMGLTGKVHVRVFDKSGRVLFSTEKPQQEWNGTYNGKPVPEDTYFYTVQLTNGKQLKGSIRVIY
ncbi:tandem-95 repeat protein [Rufibacter ruber]|uniref:tandem-95 repeat protein n=1 Tax=Rufibacter ruber TaxID=1783499 RepID=UPI0009EED35A|nr:Ig-like domain-containing protein [Rufibacter ruber]